MEASLSKGAEFPHYIICDVLILKTWLTREQLCSRGYDIAEVLHFDARTEYSCSIVEDKSGREIQWPICWTGCIRQTMIGHYVPGRLRSDQAIQAIQER